MIPCYSVVFFMGFEVAHDPRSKSGFAIAPRDAKGRGDLLSDLRLAAGVALVKKKVASLIVTTGMVQLEDSPGAGLNSATVICDMLVRDHGLMRHQVEPINQDGKTTMGAMPQIGEYMFANRLVPRDCAVLTNFFHALRTQEMVDKAELDVPVVAAEAILIALGEATPEHIEQRLREADLANLIAGESKGLAALWKNEYK